MYVCVCVHVLQICKSKSMCDQFTTCLVCVLQIFCKTKSMCDQLTTSLPTDFKSAALHGDKMQRERDYVLAAFRRVSKSVGVCARNAKDAWFYIARSQDAGRKGVCAGCIHKGERNC